MQNVNEPGSIWGALLSDKPRQRHAIRRTARRRTGMQREPPPVTFTPGTSPGCSSHTWCEQAARELPQALRRNRATAKRARLV